MAQPILLCFLSTHTSGLPDKPTNLKSDNANPFAEYSKEDLYEFLRIYTIPKNIGYDFRYSSLGIALLGHAMELAAKRKYEDLIIDSVCGKMQMNETRISLSGDQKSRFLNGHKSNGDLAQHWTFDVLAPSGALHSTIRDMMKFLSANTGTSPSLLKDVLDYTHNPRINFHDKEHGEASIGLSWMIQPIGIEERNYVWQSGLTGGFASFIGFVETSKNGIVVLSNSAVEVDKLGEEILRKIEESVEY
jgi:CubicO group peptidase (beta-lactamase class C family)